MRGNLQALSRRGRYRAGEDTRYGLIDSLDYTYLPLTNRLQTVADNASGEGAAYGYDGSKSGDYQVDPATGNLRFDPGRQLIITYNHLNLPQTFVRQAAGYELRHLYTAGGSKLQEVKVSITDSGEESVVSTRDYLGPAVYTGGMLESIQHAHGRLVPLEGCVPYLRVEGKLTGTTMRFAARELVATAQLQVGSGVVFRAARTELRGGFSVPVGATLEVSGGCNGGALGWQYQYYLKDHLGNNRLLFADTEGDGVVDSSDIIEERHYYSFGMEMEGPWVEHPGVANRYRYNGMEINEDLGGIYTAFYRSYDPTFGRWMQIDPRAEKYLRMSPYNGMGNNPITYADPMGDTLSGVNQVSAERALSLIQGSFGNGDAGKAMAALFSISADGQTFNTINSGDFLSALSGLVGENMDAAILAVGYLQTVNGSDNNLVEVVARNESVSSGLQKLGSAYETGADLDYFDGGGRYASSSNFAGGSPDGHYAAVVWNTAAAHDNYSDGHRRPTSPGALLAHELLGHGQGSMYDYSDGAAQAVQMENAYYGANKRSYYRNNHGPAVSTQFGFNPHGRPPYYYPLNLRNIFPR